MTAQARDVVCVSSADWDAPLWTNKQHLMSRLAAAGMRVLYMDSLGLRRPRVGGEDASRIIRRLSAWRPFARPVAPRLLRDSPLVIPLHDRETVQRLNVGLLRARMWRNRHRHRLREPLLWTYVPAAVELFDEYSYRALVYHCVDDLASYPGVDEVAFERQERRLIARADACVASSRPLEKHLLERGARDVIYWPNPADTAAFAEAARPRSPEREHPVVGFVGAIEAHKVDVELVKELARSRPEWTFELIGPVGLGLGGTSIRRSDFTSNVRFWGTVDREYLPEWMARWDVAIVPYAINDYTQSVFPMKVFEYLGSGLPVVSTPLPSLVGEVDHVAFAEDSDGFERAIEQELLRVDAQPDRMAYASKHSWEARVEQALDLIESVGRRPPAKSADHHRSGR